MNGRGGVDLGGDRPVPPPNPKISTISIFKKGLLGMTQDDHRRMRKYLASPIDKILCCTLPLCQQDGDRLRSAVVYLEEREARLAVCEFSWGACAILSRALQNRRPRRRRGRVTARADTGAPSTTKGDGSGTAGADGDAPPAQATAEQQLAQQQLDRLNELE